MKLYLAFKQDFTNGTEIQKVYFGESDTLYLDTYDISFKLTKVTFNQKEIDEINIPLVGFIFIKDNSSLFIELKDLKLYNEYGYTDILTAKADNYYYAKYKDFSLGVDD